MENIFSALVDGSTEAFKALFESNPEASHLRDEQGMNLIHVAAHNDDVAAIEFMVEKGMRVNLTDADGLPPLFYAAAEGSYDAASRLLDLGADVTSACIEAAGEEGHMAVYELLESRM